MIEQAGRFIGMMAADIANLFRGRQLVPCTVDWPEEPDGDPDVSSVFVHPTRLTKSECCDSCEHGCWGE